MKILTFDTETTGLPDFKAPADGPTQPRLCSLSMLLHDEAGEPISSYTALVKPDSSWPEGEVPEGALKVHGLSRARLEAEGVPILDILKRYNWGITQADLMVAFGFRFDSKIMRGELRRAGTADRYGEVPSFCLMAPCSRLCKIAPTEKMSASGRNWSKTPKLTEAVEILLGERHEGAHTSLADAAAGARLFAYLYAKGEVRL